MTVKECIKTYTDNRTKVYWLCPYICENQSITPKPFEQGIDFQNEYSIPNEIYTSNMTKVWREENGRVLCIIWDNRRMK